jgi:hypothetical protein
MRVALQLTALLPADVPQLPNADTVRAVWLADLHPDRVQPGPGRFVFVSDSAIDEVDGPESFQIPGKESG